MRNFCVVSNCSNQEGKSSTSFFKFPNDYRYKLWKKVLGFTKNHKYAYLSREQCHSSLIVCAVHFTEEDFRNTKRKLLKKHVVPSLHLGNETEGPDKIYKSKTFTRDSIKFASDAEDPDTTMTNPASSESQDNPRHENWQSTDESDNDSDDFVIHESERASKKKFLSPKYRFAKKWRKVSQIPGHKISDDYNAAEKDECGLFCDFIAEKLRRMDRRARATLQYQIHSLIFQAETNQENEESEGLPT